MPPTDDLLQSAFAHHQQGNLAAAEPIYRQILVDDANNAAVLHLLGALCLQSNRADEAVDLIGKAVSIDPANPEFYNHLGAAYGALKQHDSAVTALRRAVQLAPQSASSHYNLGTALRNAERLEEAVASFKNSIAANPASPETHYNLANTLRELRRFDEAEAAYREALRLRPGYLRALVNLGNLLRQRERLAEAVETLRAALEIDPRHANAHLNLGTALRDAGHYAEAVATLRRALELDPTCAETHNNLGTTLQAQADFTAAKACYDEALRLDPDLADGHFSLATWKLRQGDIAGGIAEYEWRWKSKTYSTRKFKEPRWDGSPLDGRTILLHAEQGLGDTLNFIRYASAVKARGPAVIVELQAPLIPLLKATPGIDQFVASGSQLPPFDVHCPLLSLPGVLNRSLETLWPGPYVFADPSLVEKWRARLADYPGFRVGICWQGNRAHLFDAQRSFPLATFAPLAAIEGVRLVSLQKGQGSEQIATSSFPVVDLGWDLDSGGPFLDTAAVMKNLDLVITTDTAIAHLAGALEVPVWGAISAHSDWRWFINRSDSPWYPSMRLFRQSKLDQWSDVFEAMAAALRERIPRDSNY